MPLFAALASLTTVGGFRLNAGPVAEIKVGHTAASESITVTRMRMPGPMPPDTALDPLLTEPMPPADMPMPMLPPLPGSQPTNFMPRMTLAGAPCSTAIGGRGITNRRGQCVLEGTPCTIGECKPGTDCQMKPIPGRYNRRGVCVQEGATCHYGCDERNLPPGAVCLPGPGEWDREGRCVPARFHDNRPPCPNGNCWTPPETWAERHGPGPMPMPMSLMPPMPFMPPPPMPFAPMPMNDMGMPPMSMMPPGPPEDDGDHPDAGSNDNKEDSAPFISMD